MILDSYIIYYRNYLMGRKSLAPLIFLYLTFFSYLPYISSSLKKGYLDTREKRKKTRLINVRRAVLSLDPLCWFPSSQVLRPQHYKHTSHQNALCATYHASTRRATARTTVHTTYHTYIGLVAAHARGVTHGKKNYGED